MATTIDTNSNTFDVVLNLINDGLAYREAGSVDTNGVYTAIVIMNDDTDDTYGFEVNNYGQHVMYRFDTTDEAEQWQDAVTIDDSPA